MNTENLERRPMALCSRGDRELLVAATATKLSRSLLTALHEGLAAGTIQPYQVIVSADWQHHGMGAALVADALQRYAAARRRSCTNHGREIAGRAERLRVALLCGAVVLEQSEA